MTIDTKKEIVDVCGRLDVGYFFLLDREKKLSTIESCQEARKSFVFLIAQ